MGMFESSTPLQWLTDFLQDQVFFTVVFQVNQTTNSQLLTNPAFGAAAAQSFLNNQSGPLTSVGVDLIGWEKLPEANRKELSNTTLAQLAEFPSDWPEIEYIPIDIAFPPADAAPTDNYLGFAVALLTPLSRGTVTINSTDTSNKPLINPNWLVATADQEVAVQAFKRIRQIAGYSGVVISEINPGTTVQSDAEILTWIQNNASPIWHASATCEHSSRVFENVMWVLTRKW